MSALSNIAIKKCINCSTALPSLEDKKGNHTICLKFNICYVLSELKRLLNCNELL